MQAKRWVAGTAVAGLLLAVGAVRAETKVELKGVHLCCVSCVNAANAILKGVDGVKGHFDPKSHSLTITAKDEAAAQKAIDALAAGGFHGESADKNYSIKDDSGAAAGKVSNVTIIGAHNCCAKCCKAIKQAVKSVPGVTGDTAKPKAKSFTVSGDFDAAELVKALNAAGFHVKVET